MAELDDESSSPKNRLKFLCSYGGKIVPRHSDGQLRYVGGETRVLVVPRSITISDLKEKINAMFNAAVVMKYQAMPEDLDTLVSVHSDEDLHHMVDEYDRQDHRPRSPTSAGSPRFRLFLLSVSPASSPLHREGPAHLEQHCVDAISGGATVPTAASISRPAFVLSSSACTSPTSTIDSAAMMNQEALLLRGRLNGVGKGGGMQRVRSTPNLSGSQSQAGNGVGSLRWHRHPQQRYSAAYGAHAGVCGGPCRACGDQLAGGIGAVRYEGWGCGCHPPRPQPVRRCFYSPAAAGHTEGSGGFGCFGHVDEACAQTSVLNPYFAAAGDPLRRQ